MRLNLSSQMHVQKITLVNFLSIGLEFISVRGMQFVN